MPQLHECPYCGAIHTGTCPRIKSIEYHENGITIKKIEFHDWSRAPLVPWKGYPINTRHPQPPKPALPSEYSSDPEAACQDFWMQ